MATYAQIGNVTVEAFQWLGDPLTGYDLPGWTNGAAGLHAPTNGSLEVTTYQGRTNAKMYDWVVRYEDGSVDLMSDALFRMYFNVGPVEAADHQRAVADAKARKDAPVLTDDQQTVMALQAQSRARTAAFNQEAADPKPTAAAQPAARPAAPVAPAKP